MAAASATPHDAVFKKYLTRTETAQDFLQIHLPPALQHHCDLNSLKLESGSFVEENLRAYYSDILYSLQTVSGKGYIYALIEHQSSPDRHMTFRLMRYAIAAMQQHLDGGHQELPVVIPVLFYHGKKSPYPFSMNWLQSFSDPQLAQQVYNSSFPLADITIISDDEIEKHRGIAVLELMQKHIYDRDLMPIADRLGRLMARGYNTKEQLQASIAYLLEAGETETPFEFTRSLIQHSPQNEELVMTIAQKLKQAGHQEGHQEGHQKGQQEGHQLGVREGRDEAKREMARSLLAMGLEMTAVMKVTGLTPEDLKPFCH